MLNKVNPSSLIQSYLSNIQWTKGPTLFSIDAFDYLELCGIAKEDIKGNESDLIDQLNGEIIERDYD